MGTSESVAEGDNVNAEEKVDKLKIRRTNMAARDLGFSFLIDGNMADEYMSMGLSTNNNFHTGFKVSFYLLKILPILNK